ncbi:NUDIX domain-containing protein [Myxococcota bacterium]|nr:NUDIX domain-containing protein [Myxococcota bacterium]
MSERHEHQLARWAQKGKPGSEPVQAATVVLVRDGDEGFQTLMLKRNSKIAFGGMWVFPGGRIDPADADPAAPADELATARRAAVREAAEEAGLVVPIDSLVPFSHWTPPPITPRRFLTWFFLAPCPNSEIEIDGGEIHEHAWMTPSQALAIRDAGEIELAPPTWVTLWTLGHSGSVQQALDAAQASPPERFETRIAVESGGPTAMWHGDVGWESGDADIPGDRHRLCMHSGGWRYERTHPRR